jgi:ribonuclease III
VSDATLPFEPTPPEPSEGSDRLSAPPGVDKVAQCQAIIGRTFQNVELLREALTHASSASRRLSSNERMEFLGDAVLGLIVCELLYRSYPDFSEGELTRVKSIVVSRRTCAKLGKELGLEACLTVGKGIIHGRSLPRSLASDAFEAVVAAIYLDGGFEAARQWLEPLLANEVQAATEGHAGGNFKSMLQQVAQCEHGATPRYRLVSERGPDHSKQFQMLAIIGEREFSPAWGRNKKDAEQRAAANAIAELNEKPPPHRD